MAVDALPFEQLLNRPGGGVDRLADLDAALGLWSGTAFDEFRHESWAEAEATRLDELRLVAAEDRAELLIALGRSGEAISSLGALIAANPYRDRPRGLLLQALSCEGRQADALRAYQGLPLLPGRRSRDRSFAERARDRAACGVIGHRRTPSGHRASTMDRPVER